MVLGNGLLATGCWMLLPAGLVDLLFTFHGPLSFALVLASWMYSDVPATNLLGGDARRSALRSAHAAPAVVREDHRAVAAGHPGVRGRRGRHRGRGRPADRDRAERGVDRDGPLGALGVAGRIGIWWPYHPLPLAYRWRNRRRWRPLLLRWAVLLLAPYAVVPALTAILTRPSVLLWTVRAPTHQVTVFLEVEGAATTCRPTPATSTS